MRVRRIGHDLLLATFLARSPVWLARNAMICMMMDAQRRVIATRPAIREVRMGFGSNGAILRVDLTSGTTSVETFDEAFYRQYPGGKALAA